MPSLEASSTESAVWGASGFGTPLGGRLSRGEDVRDDCFVARFPLLATRELGFGLPATLVCGVSTNAFVGFASRARLTLLERRSLDWAFAFEAFDRELPLGGREFALACALFGMGWTAALGFFLVEPFLGLGWFVRNL